MTFDIEKTRTKSTNTASISVYDLSQATRDRILDKDALVRVAAGYVLDGGAKLLFLGTAQYIHHALTLPGVVTIIESQDGALQLREVRVSLSFGPGASGAAVLAAIARALNLPLTTVPFGGNFSGGFAFAGPASQALDQVTRRFSLEWSIQGGELRVIRRNDNAGTEAVLISADAGMIGSPERVRQNKGELSGSTKTEPEWEVRVLLQPRLEPGGIVKLESKLVNGFFTIESVKHSGDNYGGDWESKVELRSIRNE